MTHMVSWLQFESHLANGDIVKGPVQLRIKHRENHRCVGGWQGRTAPALSGRITCFQLRLYSDLQKKKKEGGGVRGKGWCKGGDGGQEKREGLGKKKTDEIKRRL